MKILRLDLNLAIPLIRSNLSTLLHFISLNHILFCTFSFFAWHLAVLVYIIRLFLSSFEPWSLLYTTTLLYTYTFIFAHLPLSSPTSILTYLYPHQSLFSPISILTNLYSHLPLSSPTFIFTYCLIQPWLFFSSVCACPLLQSSYLSSSPFPLPACIDFYFLASHIRVSSYYLMF